MKNILVVDDEQRIRDLFSDELTDAGYNVVTAESADDAMDKMSFGAPDLMVLDVRMPGKTGLDLLGDIRHHFPDLPIIICTALHGMHEDYTVWENQVSACLTKPVDLEQLRAKVEELIGPAA